MVFLFSIITPIYKTPIYKLQRLYNSLINQSINNWEWIVLDDSPENYKECSDFISKISENDNRIKLYSNEKNIGIIGEVKRKAFLLGNGDILVEVDHDDELVNTCLENLQLAYSYDSEIGFAYGNCCEIYEDDEIIDYGDNWAFGYGRYQQVLYNNKNYKVAIAPNINPKTIRHITGIPNHVRSWKKDIYLKINGHNNRLSVGDDYELFVRTFLNTKIAKINEFTYIQYFEKDKNTQFRKNQEIQDIVNYTVNFYNNKIHNRFLELNIDDYVWNQNGFDIDSPSVENEEYVNIIIPDSIKPNISSKNLYGFSRLYDNPIVSEYKQTEHYSNLIEWIIKLTNCQSYLELGVENDEIIKKIFNIVKNYVGIVIDDNLFENNYNNIKLNNISTDTFFKQNTEKFDIIFINYCHNFDQLKKDFDNSFKILNKYGILIINNTDPIKEELMSTNCDSYKIIDYVSKMYLIDIITFPIHETGLTFIMKKNEKRINEFL